MADVYEKLHEMGVSLPEVPPRGGVYAPAKRFGEKLVYISGCGPTQEAPWKGKVGKDLTKEQAKNASYCSMKNVLAVLEKEIGDLNQVKQVVKILTFVSSSPDFYEQPYVANGGSQFLVDLFGEAAGAPSRSAIGVNVLPGDIPVETEAIFELK